MDNLTPPTPSEARRITETPACEHEWEFVDDSFDHEFGCERIHYWRCEKCEATKSTVSADYHEPDHER